MAILFEAIATATFDNPTGGFFQRIFDFGNGEGVDNIWLGNTDHSTDIAFEIFQNGTRYRLVVPGAITPGVSAEWRVTATDDGTLSIWKDGALIGSQTFGAAAAPNDVDRASNLIGASNFAVDDDLIGTVDELQIISTPTAGFSITDAPSLERVGMLIMTDAGEVLDATAATSPVHLDAGGGDDRLTGGAGDDVLIGGAGDDVFAISAGGGTDSLTDFGTGADAFDTSALSDIGAAGTDQDGTVTANEVVVTGGGGADQVLTFPNGEQVIVPDGTVDTSSDQARFASLVALGVPPCFLPGTRIATPDGETPVEALRPGDLVRTIDHGAQPLLWIGRREEPLQRAPPCRRPVEIKPGALGPGIPARALRLSPLHRVAVGRPEALIPARALLVRRGVRAMAGRRSAVYYVLLLARHEILLAEGARVESFLPGPVALAGFTPQVRARIHALLPPPPPDAAGRLLAPARPLLGVRAARGLGIAGDAPLQGMATEAAALPAPSQTRARDQTPKTRAADAAAEGAAPRAACRPPPRAVAAQGAGAAAHALPPPR